MVRHALIVAGGEGTRLRSAEPDRPKALVEVAGEPLLERHLRLLARHGVERAVIATVPVSGVKSAPLAAVPVTV